MRGAVSSLLTLALAAGGLHLQAAGDPDAALLAASKRLAVETQFSGQAYRNLAELCDTVGNRLSGSAGFERALPWAVKAMKDAGLQNVHLEPVMVPHWVRNHEAAQVLLPAPHELSILGLGGSVATPKGGLTADVVVVRSGEELEQMKDADVKGKIVLFEMPFSGYGPMVKYRIQGPAMAARKGAVAMLLRSIASLSFDTPHTGTTHYDPAVPAIPAAAVSVENAMMMRRMWERHERIQVHLEMNCETLPDVPGANVVGELPGSSRPEEIVLIGGHLDSWDVGQGAQDDGVGIVMALDAAHLIREAGLKPKRTVRVVFFANEENGTRGGKGYVLAHKAELARHVAMIETDSGSGPIRGLTLELHPVEGGKAPDAAKSLALLRRLGPALEPLGAGRLELGHSGTDVEPTVETGVPGIGVSHDTSHYWEIHHSKADTFDKVVKEDLVRNAAILAVAVYGLAELPERLPVP